jgi:hypothetical protein
VLLLFATWLETLCFNGVHLIYWDKYPDRGRQGGMVYIGPSAQQHCETLPNLKTIK